MRRSGVAAGAAALAVALVAAAAAPVAAWFQGGRCSTVSRLVLDEGCNMRLHQDGLGQDHIGVGFYLYKSGACTALSAQGLSCTAVRSGSVTLTGAQALALLNADMATAESCVTRNFPGYSGWTADRKSALINMAYNLGCAGMLAFRNMVSAIKAGDWNRAAAEAIDSQWCGQVGPRCSRIIDCMAPRRGCCTPRYATRSCVTDQCDWTPVDFTCAVPQPPTPGTILTAMPTRLPTAHPTAALTPAPTRLPTAHPTAMPVTVVVPTPPPTPPPTRVPTKRPTAWPTPLPTRYPTPFPTPQPTPQPTVEPTPQPTRLPTPAPTPRPTDPSEPDVDCVERFKGPWSECDAPCGKAGIRTREREVVTPASGNGADCKGPAQERCVSAPCPPPPRPCVDTYHLTARRRKRQPVNEVPDGECPPTAICINGQCVVTSTLFGGPGQPQRCSVAGCPCANAGDEPVVDDLNCPPAARVCVRQRCVKRECLPSYTHCPDSFFPVTAANVNGVCADDELCADNVCTKLPEPCTQRGCPCSDGACTAVPDATECVEGRCHRKGCSAAGCPCCADYVLQTARRKRGALAADAGDCDAGLMCDAATSTCVALPTPCAQKGCPCTSDTQCPDTASSCIGSAADNKRCHFVPGADVGPGGGKGGGGDGGAGGGGQGGGKGGGKGGGAVRFNVRLVDGDFDKWTEADTERVRAALLKLLDVAAERLKNTAVRPGSVLLEFELAPVDDSEGAPELCVLLRRLTPEDLAELGDVEIDIGGACDGVPEPNQAGGGGGGGGGPEQYDPTMMT